MATIGVVGERCAPPSRTVYSMRWAGRVLVPLSAPDARPPDDVTACYGGSWRHDAPVAGCGRCPGAAHGATMPAQPTLHFAGIGLGRGMAQESLCRWLLPSSPWLSAPGPWQCSFRAWRRCAVGPSASAQAWRQMQHLGMTFPLLPTDG